jgi:hypothetical protein
VASRPEGPGRVIDWLEVARDLDAHGWPSEATRFPALLAEFRDQDRDDQEEELMDRILTDRENQMADKGIALVCVACCDQVATVPLDDLPGLTELPEHDCPNDEEEVA